MKMACRDGLAVTDRQSQVICFRAAAISDFLERYTNITKNHVLVTSSLILCQILISRCPDRDKVMLIQNLPARGLGKLI